MALTGLVGLLINLIILLVILAIVYVIAQQIIAIAGGPPIALRILQLVMLLIILLWFLSWLGGEPLLFYRTR